MGTGRVHAFEHIGGEVLAAQLALFLERKDRRVSSEVHHRPPLGP